MSLALAWWITFLSTGQTERRIRIEKKDTVNINFKKLIYIDRLVSPHANMRRPLQAINYSAILYNYTIIAHVPLGCRYGSCIIPQTWMGDN